MLLPKIDLPIYPLTLFSNKKKITYRPFTVKEEKILLMAQESDDIDQAILSIKQVINNCVTGIDVEDLPMFDLEYILLKLRSKSVNNVTDFTIIDPETKENISLQLDLDDVKLTTYDSHTNKIKLNDEYTLFLKYPNVDMFSKFITYTETAQSNYEIMVSCLDKLASESTVYKFSDFTKEDIDGFLNDLDGNVIKNITNFFDTMPKLRHEIKYTNSNGKEKTFVIEGTKTFFI